MADDIHHAGKRWLKYSVRFDGNHRVCGILEKQYSEKKITPWYIHFLINLYILSANVFQRVIFYEWISLARKPARQLLPAKLTTNTSKIQSEEYLENTCAKAQVNECIYINAWINADTCMRIYLTSKRFGEVSSIYDIWQSKCALNLVRIK